MRLFQILIGLFLEFMSCYFDDLIIDDNYEYPLSNNWVTKKEFEIIEKWHLALDKYEPPNKDYYDSVSVLNDTEWLDILSKGICAKRKLAKILSDTEIKYLTREIDYLKSI